MQMNVFFITWCVFFSTMIIHKEPCTLLHEIGVTVISKHTSVHRQSVSQFRLNSQTCHVDRTPQYSGFPTNKDASTDQDPHLY